MLLKLLIFIWLSKVQQIVETYQRFSEEDQRTRPKKYFQSRCNSSTSRKIVSAQNVKE